MTLEGINLLHVIFVFHSCFFGVLTLRQSRLRAFSLLLLMFAFHMLYNILIESNVIAKGWDYRAAFGFLYGPLFYLFIRNIIQAKPSFYKYDLLHILPFLACLPFAPDFGIRQSIQLNITVLVMISLAGYCAGTVIELRQFRSILHVGFSNDRQFQMQWLSIVFWGVVVVFGLDLVRMVMRLNAELVPEWTLTAIRFTSVTGFFCILNFLILKSIRFPSLFSGLEPVDVNLMEDGHAETASNPLSEMEQETLDMALRELEEKEYFKNPRLKLSELADAVGLDPKNLSDLLQRDRGQRFSTPVNKLRIEYAKEKIRQHGEGPIQLLALGYEAGFNSKSAFNEHFKADTGMTPSQYWKQCQDR